jgi:hypothetical protein
MPKRAGMKKTAATSQQAMALASATRVEVCHAMNTTATKYVT